jgi:hypothetical protein
VNRLEEALAVPLEEALAVPLEEALAVPLEEALAVPLEEQSLESSCQPAVATHIRCMLHTYAACYRWMASDYKRGTSQ